MLKYLFTSIQGIQKYEEENFNLVKLMIVLLYLSKKGFDAVIDYLDSQYLKKELPANVRDVYNEEEYEKWIAYEREGGKFETISDIVEITFNLFLLVSNAYAWVFNRFAGMNVFAKYLALVVVFSLASSIIGIPFDYYDAFVLEEKYGLNTSTRKTFWLDAVKNLGIGVALAYIVVVVIMVLFDLFGNAAILLCSLVMMGFITLLALVIVPLMRIFNKFQPLEDGELKDSLLTLCDKNGIRVRKIVVRDASRRTTTANAFCAGFGSMKTISLDDNLLNEYSTEEITAVFAHEFGHAKYHHTAKSLPFTIINLLIIFSSLAIVLNIPQLYTAFGFDGMNYYFGTALLGVILWPVTTVLEAVSNRMSRGHEYQADAFAAKSGYGQALIAALKKLTKESLSDINPHPAEVALHYSHPTLSQRISAIEKIDSEMSANIPANQEQHTEKQEKEGEKE